jgi:aryl-alcohol dehydrogenase-like predicted oxidoreductase
METRQLGNSDLQITPIGFGAWAIGGGDWQFSWGPQEDADSVAAIHRAIDLGMNWIDTAAVYGLGHSEEVVGRALKGMHNRPYVFTKCELVWNEKREITRSMKEIRREVEDSLRRLDLGVIDLYQIHWPFPEEEIEEGWATMADLQKQGKVRWIGVSNFNVEQLKRAQKIAPVTSLQPPYSLINNAVEEEMLPFCGQQGIGVINYSPMQSGLLTGAMTAERIANLPADDWRRGNKDFQEPRLSRNLKLVALLAEVGKQHGRSPGEVAIAWTLRLSAITGAIVGGRNAKQVEGIIGAGAFRLSSSEIAEIQAFVAANPLPAISIV